MTIDLTDQIERMEAFEDKFLVKFEGLYVNRSGFSGGHLV